MSFKNGIFYDKITNLLYDVGFIWESRIDFISNTYRNKTVMNGDIIIVMYGDCLTIENEVQSAYKVKYKDMKTPYDILTELDKLTT